MILLRQIYAVSTRFMAGVFRAKINPVTGRMDWVVEDETYDFYQEIARSGYGDMLHDTERNIMYNRAIKNVVTEIKDRGENVHVLDIGTGSGLLSMMAAAAGADRISACEAFMPMAKTAKKVIASNGFGDKIKIIEKRSTDMTENDLAGSRANVCVAEVFDTELIGEGALRTFIEAHERLLKKNARVIPSKATIYIQLINSDLVHGWSNVQSKSIDIDGRQSVTVDPPHSCVQCPGNNTVHDLQLNQLPRSSFTLLTEPIPVFNFDFENSVQMKYDDCVQIEAVPLADSTAHALFMWWTLDMDGSGQLILSTKPNWDEEKQVQWRDHWMQAVYYLPKPIVVKKGEPFWVVASHDEHSLWFSTNHKHEPSLSHPVPTCQCGIHSICSRGNIGFLNDQSRYKRILASLDKVVREKICLCISDLSMVSIFALKMGAKQVHVVQNGTLHRDVICDFANANGINVGRDLILISDISEIDHGTKFACVFGDPFFFSSLLPWHNLHYWYKIQEARKAGLLQQGCCILPKRAHLMAVALELKDLWKIRAPVQAVEGFDLRIFDHIAQKAMDLCDAEVEPHPLWEYPGIAVSHATRLASYDLTSEIPRTNVENAVEICIERCGIPNALALWIDWEFGHDQECSSMVSTGLQEACEVGQLPEWNRNVRQGVYFIRNDRDAEKIEIITVFDIGSGELKFKIRPLSK